MCTTLQLLYMTHNSCTSVHHYLHTCKSHCVVLFIASIWIVSSSVSTIALEIPLILRMPHGGEGGLSAVQYMMYHTWYLTVTGRWLVLHNLQINSEYSHSSEDARIHTLMICMYSDMDRPLNNTVPQMHTLTLNAQQLSTYIRMQLKWIYICCILYT